jgi:hypothetical protein
MNAAVPDPAPSARGPVVMHVGDGDAWHLLDTDELRMEEALSMGLRHSKPPTRGHDAIIVFSLRTAEGIRLASAEFQVVDGYLLLVSHRGPTSPDVDERTLQAIIRLRREIGAVHPGSVVSRTISSTRQA